MSQASEPTTGNAAMQVGRGLKKAVNRGAFIQYQLGAYDLRKAEDSALRK